ncbi:hypothetical protein A9239_09355 [Methanosarcina sp. A14]|uniref:Uncharacterized protein n=2 Tax=Methanosarcina barkeri TaxID=2208 RepID=A0A0E3QPG6_METBA|nr:hypothetical protein MSBRM_0116 [Methanosarcina barkeri MS]AKB58780.1 hypothetical protein MSBR2_2264 [Methanosarcina barkeri 227]OED08362.1 hypothetical protein A9239_09355 [Methanosarcina sp. A14]
MPFYSPSKSTFPGKTASSGASFLLHAEPEATLNSDQDLYSYQEFESNGFSDSKTLFGQILIVNFFKDELEFRNL